MSALVSAREQKKEIALVVRELSEKHPLTEILKLSGIPRSTYYYFQSQKEIAYSFDIGMIKKVFKENKGRYSYRRITIALNKLPEYKNNPINHKKFLKLMRLMGLKCKSKNVF